MKEIILIAAVAENGVIGRDGNIPWRIKEDMKHFKDLTLNHPVIMGRKTYDSLPEHFRPLPDRTNVIITRQGDYDSDGIVVVHSLEEALSRFDENVYVIGGQQIYELAMPYATKLEITEVHGDYKGDAFFPEIDYSEWNLVDEDNRAKFSFLTYVRK